LKINSLEIVNFRSYQNKHNITFSIKPDKKITLFLGDNGGGKTTLLNAIYWCLTGELTPSCDLTEGIKNTDAKISNPDAQCYCELKYFHDDINYRLRRTLNNDQTIRLDLWKTDNTGVDRSVNYPDNELKKIIPKNIAKWFYYDAESFTKLTLEGSKAFKEDLRKTLGFEMIDLTLMYLNKARSKKIRMQTGLVSDEEITSLQTNVTQAEEILPALEKNYKDEEIEYENYEAKINGLSKKLTEITIAQGFQRDYDNEINTLKILKSDEDTLQDRAAKMQGEAFPSILIFNLLDKLGDSLDIKEKKGEIPSPWNSRLLEIILKDAECICGKKLDKAIEKKIKDRFQNSTTGEFNQKITLLGGSLVTIKDYFTKFSNNYAKLSEEINSNIQAISDSENKLREYKQALIKLDNNEVNEIMNKRDDLEREKKKHWKQSIQAKTFHDDTKSKLKKNISELEIKLKSVGLTNNIQKQIDKIDLIISYIEDLSKEQENKAIDIIEKELNKTISNGFNKDYQATIDKLNYSIRLNKNNGQPVSKSSGEGEFLKYAFVSSILNLSKGKFSNEISFLSEPIVSPLVIDAPFSGLGANYTKQCADSIYEASEQLILMMLPEVLSSKKVAETIEKFIDKKYVIFFSTTEKTWDKEISSIDYDGEKIPIVKIDQPFTGSTLVEL
jgi:DNA sulfur modification protein DndD